MGLSADQIASSARLLIDARRQGHRLASLPEAGRPATIEDAHAIQDTVLASSDASVGAIKVNATKDGDIFRGKVDAAICQRSPAAYAVSEGMLAGLEAEIAFVFPDGLAPAPDGYSLEAASAAAEACAAFDIVGSRFQDFMTRSPFERIADSLSAAGFVHGPSRADWRDINFGAMAVAVSIDGVEVFAGTGGHPAIDPFGPAVAYLNTVRGTGLPPGTILTTGSFCGLLPVAPGQHFRATLGTFEPIEVTLRATAAKGERASIMTKPVTVC